MKNKEPETYSFSQKEVNDALSWTEEIVSETGTRLTGSAGCRKAANIIYQKFQEVCASVTTQDFVHSRDAFLSVVKLMTISYVIALISIWLGGNWNYIGAFCMIFVSIATISEFMYYQEK